MSSPFQQKFMAKNPTKGFTLDQLKKASDKSQKEMVKNADILNKQNPEAGGPNYEKKEEFDFPGADGYDGSVEKTDSPLNGAYESGAGASVYVSNAPAFSKLQNQINASTKEAIYGLAKDKKDEFKGETKKVSKKLKETTDEGFEYKPFDSSDNYFEKTGK
jgi:hypothetical protein